MSRHTLSRMLLARLLCLSNSISCSVYRVPQSIHFTECHKIFLFIFFPDKHTWPPRGSIGSSSAPAHLSSPFQVAPGSYLDYDLQEESWNKYFSLSLSIQDVTSARTLTATVKTVFLIDSERRFLVADIASRGVGELPSHTPHVAARYHHPPNADLLHKLWATSTESDTVCSQI